MVLIVRKRFMLSSSFALSERYDEEDAKEWSVEISEQIRNEVKAQGRSLTLSRCFIGRVYFFLFPFTLFLASVLWKLCWNQSRKVIRDTRSSCKWRLAKWRARACGYLFRKCVHHLRQGQRPSIEFSSQLSFSASYIIFPRLALKVTSRSLWDTKTDNYASSNFQNVCQSSPCFVEFRFVPLFRSFVRVRFNLG